MKIVCLSDTHSRLMEYPVPDGDLLIHAGDATIQGSIEEVSSFAYWFNALPHRHKIFVAGNHDWLYYRNPTLANTMVKSLHDELTEIEGLKIYGSSWQPEFHNWAFGLTRGKELEKVWERIPDEVDILVTHTPPKFIRDQNFRGWRVGCEDLYKRVLKIKPKLHVFGHLHESYGVTKLDGTIFVNASICNAAYQAVNKPIVIEF